MASDSRKYDRTGVLTKESQSKKVDDYRGMDVLLNALFQGPGYMENPLYTYLIQPREGQYEQTDVDATSRMLRSFMESYPRNFPTGKIVEPAFGRRPPDEEEFLRSLGEIFSGGFQSKQQAEGRPSEEQVRAQMAQILSAALGGRR